jgi:hypothetical protein
MPPKINGSNAFSGIYLKSAYETNKVKISTVQEIKKSKVLTQHLKVYF